MSWYWNEIDGKNSARYATTAAVWVSYLTSVGSGIAAIAVAIFRQPILEWNGGSLVKDILFSLMAAILFSVIGWQIARLSRTWSVVGLSLVILKLLIWIGTNPLQIMGPATIINALDGLPNHFL